MSVRGRSVGPLGGIQHSGGRTSHATRRRQRLRAGLITLAIATGVVGVWALAAPRSFFDDFPTGAVTWIHQLRKYSEHLTRDVGAFNLAFCVLFVWAALTLDRRVVRAVTSAWFVFSLPHLVFHLFHLDPYTSTEAISQSVFLVVGTLLPVVLFSWSGKLEDGRGFGRF